MWSWLAIGLSGMTSVLGARQASPFQSLFFKVFTLVLLLILVLTQGPDSAHSYWIAAGLLVSIFADTLHSLKSKKRSIFQAFSSHSFVTASLSGYNSMVISFGGSLPYCWRRASWRFSYSFLNWIHWFFLS